MRVNNIISGKINGITPYEKYGEIGRLDRNVTDLKTRTENINEILEEDDFFVDYFSDRYNPSIDQDSALSEENNICQMLGSMADYLINSDESKDIDKKNKTFYVFSEDVEKRKLERRNKKNENNELDENVMMVSKPIKPAEFKSNNIEIHKNDLSSNNNEMNKILSEYSEFLVTINNKIENNPSKTKKYSSIKSSILDDMKMVKESYLGILPRSKSVPGGHFEKKIPTPNYKDVKVFKRLINTMPAKLEDSYELWENSFDFLNLLNNCEKNHYITPTERDIIILRMYGWEYSEILSDLNLEFNSRNDELHLNTNVIRNIHNKIVKYIEEKNNEKTK